MQGDFSGTGRAGRRQGRQSLMATAKPSTQALQGRSDDSDRWPLSHQATVQGWAMLSVYSIIIF